MPTVSSQPNTGHRTIAFKMAATALLALIADWAFLSQPIGFLYGLYAAALPLTMVWFNPALIAARSGKIALISLLGLALALFYAPSTLAILLYLLGLVTLISLHKRQALKNSLTIISDSLFLFFETFKRATRDRAHVSALKLKGRTKLRTSQTYKLFVVPLFLGGFFLFLFARANPMIADAFSFLRFDLHISPHRLIYVHLPFLTVFALAIWALLRPRFQPCPNTLSTPPNLDVWINRTSLVLSLILFNLIFALQNSLDLMFLWSGQAELPHGLSYAQYAHSGAYPLIVTAILAAVYVLVVFSEHQTKLHSPVAEKLVYVWIAQNVFLVMSSVDRVLNYISVYSLTYLRLAALIWMGLIIAGLLLISARILWRKTNEWLINGNMLILSAVLYACCFINLPCMITSYNLTQATQSADAASRLDLRYIRQLGDEALPALADFLHKTDPANPVAQLVAEIYPGLRGNLQIRLSEDWRAWTFERAQLAKLPYLAYLRADETAAPTPQTP